MSESGRYEVRFHPEALAEWNAAFPDMPSGDELVLWVEPGPCSICSKEMEDGEMGCFDPEAVTSDGQLLGQHICMDCAQEGH